MIGPARLLSLALHTSTILAVLSTSPNRNLRSLNNHDNKSYTTNTFENGNSKMNTVPDEATAMENGQTFTAPDDDDYDDKVEYPYGLEADEATAMEIGQTSALQGGDESYDKIEHSNGLGADEATAMETDQTFFVQEDDDYDDKIENSYGLGVGVF